MIWTSAQFEEAAKSRPQGWRDEMLVAAQIGADSIEVSQQTYEALTLKYRLPSLLDRIKSLARAAGEAAATGLEVRGEVDTERVFSICAVCPYLVVDTFVCGRCSCRLAYKAQWTSFGCPENKW